jgi:hypothetical protein
MLYLQDTLSGQIFRLQKPAFHFLKGPPIIFIASMKPTPHFPTIPATYPSTLTNLTLIILFSEKFSIVFFPNQKILWRITVNIYFLKWKFQN